MKEEKKRIRFSEDRSIRTPSLRTWTKKKTEKQSQGHARAYVSFDIVRRVLEDWFNLDVHLVMNVTDVDDKIIARARRKVVLETYLKNGLVKSDGDDGASSSAAPPPSAAQVKRDASAAVALALERQELRLKRAQEAAKAEGSKKEASGDGGGGGVGATVTAIAAGNETATSSLDRRLAKELAESVSVEELKTDQLRSASSKLVAAPENDLKEILTAAGDVLSEHLDKELGLGACVTDPAVFREHAWRYEAEFLRDMRELRVRPPSVLTRVSEYMEGEKVKSFGLPSSFFFTFCFHVFLLPLFLTAFHRTKNPKQRSSPTSFGLSNPASATLSRAIQARIPTLPTPMSTSTSALSRQRASPTAASGPRPPPPVPLGTTTGPLPLLPASQPLPLPLPQPPPQTPSAPPQTLPCGRQRNRANPAGPRPGAEAGPGGT